MRRLLALLLVAPLAGCAMPWVDDDVPGGGVPPTSTTVTPVPAGPPLTFGGVVTDARTGAPVAGAEVRLDLAQVRPCRQEGIVWTSWDDVTREDGRFGPLTVPRPRSDDVAFFLHVFAEGHSDDVTYFGAVEARRDIGNLSLAVHELANVTGTAAPGTLVALEWPGFPRVTVASADGAWRFENAQVTPAQLVAATDPPHRASVTAPATIDLPAGNASGWRLEGVVRRESGAPSAADLVAWNGTALVGVARAAENGVFVLQLPGEPLGLRIEARTEDGRFAGTRALDVAGPPAARETVLLRAAC